MSADAPDLAFDEQSLLPAVAQDANSGDILMLAYVSSKASSDRASRSCVFPSSHHSDNN